VLLLFGCARATGGLASNDTVCIAVREGRRPGLLDCI